MVCDDHDVPVLPSFLVKYGSTDLCDVRTISKLLSIPSDPLDNLRAKLRSLLGLPELTNDISVSELTNDMSVSVNEVSAYDFVLEPRSTLAYGDLFFACFLGEKFFHVFCITKVFLLDRIFMMQAVSVRSYVACRCKSLLFYSMRYLIKGGRRGKKSSWESKCTF